MSLEYHLRITKYYGVLSGTIFRKMLEHFRYYVKFRLDPPEFKTGSRIRIR